MKWELHDGTAFLDLYAEWASARAKALTTIPLLHPDFVESALRYFGDERTYALSGSGAGQKQILLPVMRHKPGRWRTFSPSQLPVAPIYVSMGKDEAIDFDGALRVFSPTTLMFEVMNYDSDYAPPIRCRGQEADSTRYGETIAIDRCLSFSEYWQSRSKKLRDNIRRYTKRATDSGKQISLSVAESPDAVQRALVRYAEIENAGWKGKAGTAITTENLQGRFYAEVLARFSERRDARIFELKFNNDVVASRIAIANDDIVVFLKTTYLEQFAKFSPGRLLLHATIKANLESSGGGRMEFCTNANRDMLQWGSMSREIVHLNLFRSNAIRRSKLALDSLRKRISLQSTD